MPHIDPQFAAHVAKLEAAGFVWPNPAGIVKPEFRQNYLLAMDAQPAAVTTTNAGIPAILTTYIDPKVVTTLTALNSATEILGEAKKGSWLDNTILFPVVENTGEVGSYGDNSRNGRAGINLSFPQRAQYRYELIVEYGDKEVETAGLTKINYVSTVQVSAAAIMAKFSNYAYFFGVQGLQNYGMLNDPALPAAIAPLVKAATGVKWWNGSALNTTANEAYADIQALFAQVVRNTFGNVDSKSQMVLGMSPVSSTALLTKNSFGLSTMDMLKTSFPNMRVQTAAQYGALSAQNQQGSAAGEVMQLVVESLDGQDVGSNCFSEKMRMFPLVRDLSSSLQKMAGGTWGSVIFQPTGVATMIGL